LVEEVLEARLKGDKEARGEKVEEGEDAEKKKRKKKVKDIKAVKLADEVVREYQEVLAKVSVCWLLCHLLPSFCPNRLTRLLLNSSTTIAAQNSGSSSWITKSQVPSPATY
jgi:hypothetical protein